MNTELKLTDFKIVTSDKIRYADTDRQGHVNNSVFNQFLETGRVEVIYNPSQPLHSENGSFVIAKLSIEFLAEVNWPGNVLIGSRIQKVGNSSFVLEQGIFQNDLIVAFAETVIVHVNKVTKKSESFADKSKKILLEKFSQ